MLSVREMFRPWSMALLLLSTASCSTYDDREEEPRDPWVSFAEEDPVWHTGVSSIPYVISEADRIRRIEVYVDDKLVQTEDHTVLGTNAYLLGLDTTAVADGEHVLRLLATDADGAQGEASGKIRVDNTPPSIEFTGVDTPFSPQRRHFAIADGASGVQHAEALIEGLLRPLDAPYDLEIYGCYSKSVKMIATDVAQNRTEVDHMVTVASACDHDCDHVLSAAGTCGGADTDDENAAVH